LRHTNQPFFQKMRRLTAQLASRLLCLLVVCVATPHVAVAQATATEKTLPESTAQSSAPGPAAADSESESSDPLTLFPHSETSRYWISGQANIILQWHPSFPAKYTGPNSLNPHAENATSKTYTLYLGYELTRTTEVFLDIESAQGHGLSNALGIAGFTNLDVVRNPLLSHDPYVARAMIRQIIPLTKELVEAGRDPLHLHTALPARRIEFRFGKFSLADFFDLNTWGTDSHLQFLNWTVDNNGAYDYAANTRGYTDGAILEYDDKWWAVRFAEALMPKVANGINLDADVARARAENLELEARGNLFLHRAGVVRLLAYLNHADMGNYEEAIRKFENNPSTPPDITATRQQGRHKYGFGLNFEQQLTPLIGFFGRLGWSDGRNESFAYTEVDRTLQLGGFTKGDAWHRRNDRAGAVFVLNGIVAAHQQYLALGGRGFLLGDGALTYGHEKIFEGFYTAHLWRGLFGSFDIQHINNPGYNKARGPVIVPALRAHVDF
jgi:high affinity Mn2+ porin